VNFRSPYRSLNITEFWRRWHISLSSWLRDYIYIPMGGNARGLFLQLFFLLVTMLIGGFWHGADWKFVFWGGAHGILLMLHKLNMRVIPAVKPKVIRAIFKPFRWAVTFCCVALLWIPFRAASMSDALVMYRSVFHGIDLHMAKLIAWNNPLLLSIFGIGVILALFSPAIKTFTRRTYDKSHFIVKMLAMVIIIQVIIQMRTADVHPFIYFDF
jgi:D-alanyl-lipoteichoic acid acyltransferase DltB (MBOAT superfamily)